MFEVRIATRADVKAAFDIRLAVRENVLSNPSAITHDDFVHEIEVTGRGWVAFVDGAVRGFSVGRRTNGNIWALFVHPDYEGRGIGRAVHEPMIAWLFAQGCATLWLTTGTGTRAELFYRRAGWRDVGPQVVPIAGGEIRMELRQQDWRR